MEQSLTQLIPMYYLLSKLYNVMCYKAITFNYSHFGEFILQKLCGSAVGFIHVNETVIDVILNQTTTTISSLNYIECYLQLMNDDTYCSIDEGHAFKL